jgi:uncharacterized protein
MGTPAAEALKVEVNSACSVSALLQTPNEPLAVYVLAHGAGAGMTHPFMSEMADALAARGIATLRFHFPFMEKGSRRPDAPAVAHAAVRAAVDEARRRLPKLPLFAGGKSFGGRMTSQAQALEPMTGVRGLIFLGFPLHPPKKPAVERADHLAKVRIPMLFLQGTRDELANFQLIETVCRSLGKAATLHVVAEADHSFHVPAKSGRKDADVREEMADAVLRWIRDQ